MGNDSDSPRRTRSSRRFFDYTNEVIGAALVVHRHLGPGLLESAYQACLTYELQERGIEVIRETPLPVVYKGVRLDVGYRIDLLVEDQLIVEVKAVERLEAVHFAQVLSYLRLAERQVGLLINFNTPLLKQGIRRVVNALPE